MGRTPVSTVHPGEHSAIEVRMSALGATALLGVPGGALAEQVVDLADLWGPAGARLVDRAAELATWPERFSLLENVLLARRLDAAHRPVPHPSLVAAHRLLLDRRGDVSMSDLLELTGWSRRRMAILFRDHVGMTPKALARLARFRHAEQLLRMPGRRSIASVAVTCGYYDQAHLDRDFRALAGCSPTAHISGLIADRAATGMPTG